MDIICDLIQNRKMQRYTISEFNAIGFDLQSFASGVYLWSWAGYRSYDLRHGYLVDENITRSAHDSVSIRLGWLQFLILARDISVLTNVLVDISEAEDVRCFSGFWHYFTFDVQEYCAGIAELHDLAEAVVKKASFEKSLWPTLEHIAVLPLRTDTK